MNTNQIKQMLIYDEGISTTAYICPAGKLTVGVGHNLEADPAKHILHRTILKGDKITKQEIELLLEYDIAKVNNQLVEKIPYFSQLQEKYKLVLVNMCFNIGINRLLQFRNMLHAMKTDNDVWVVAEIKNSKYYKQVQNRATRMIKIINNQEVHEYN